MQALAVALNRINSLAEIKKIPTELLADKSSELVLVIGAVEKTNYQLINISELFLHKKNKKPLHYFKY